VQEGDIILVSLRDYQDEVADIIHKYYREEARVSRIHNCTEFYSTDIPERGVTLNPWNPLWIRYWSGPQDYT